MTELNYIKNNYSDFKIESDCLYMAYLDMKPTLLLIPESLYLTPDSSCVLLTNTNIGDFSFELHISNPDKSKNSSLFIELTKNDISEELILWFSNNYYIPLLVLFENPFELKVSTPPMLVDVLKKEVTPFLAEDTLPDSILTFTEGDVNPIVFSKIPTKEFSTLSPNIESLELNADIFEGELVLYLNCNHTLIASLGILEEHITKEIRDFFLDFIEHNYVDVVLFDSTDMTQKISKPIDICENTKNRIQFYINI